MYGYFLFSCTRLYYLKPVTDIKHCRVFKIESLNKAIIIIIIVVVVVLVPRSD